MSTSSEQKDGFGIDVLYDPVSTNQIPERQIVDIGAVHGLAGGNISTWTHPTTKKMWLRDFLPSEIPEARIMTFGYEADPRSREQLGILSIAQGLLQGVKAHRVGTILIAKEREDPLLEALFGIMFMGVPHKGADIATMATSLAHIVAFATPTTTVLLKELQPGSPTLQELSNSWQFLPTRIMFISVFESAKTSISAFRGSTWVVPKESAMLFAGPREIEFPILGADHRSICKFPSADDKQYFNVWTSLRELVEQANGGLAPKRYLVDTKTVRNFTARTELETMNNLFRHHETRRYIVGIHGLPGVGKTQLAVKYAEESKNAYDSVFFILATTPHDLEAGFGQLATFLDLPAKYQEDNQVKLRAVKEWFRTAKSWLLILDNVQQKDRDTFNDYYLPGDDHGHILITTRSRVIAEELADTHICLDPLENPAAVDLLLKGARLDINDPELRELAEKIAVSLEGLPLALNFASSTVMGMRERFAKLAEDLCDPVKKQEFYRDRKYPFDGGQSTLEYLFLLRFQEIEGNKESKDPADKEPGELWKVFAFLNPSSISFSFFSATPNPTSPPLPDRYQKYKIDSLLDGIVAQGFVTTKSSDNYFVHDEIHAWNQLFVLQSNGKSQDEVSQYATTWIIAEFRMYRAFDTWRDGNTYVRHAKECSELMKRLSIESADLGRMLTDASEYTRFAGQYSQSEELVRKAIAILERQQNVPKEDIFKANDTLALALRRQSKWEEAQHLLEANLSEQEKVCSLLDRLTLGTVNELGWLYYLKGDYTTAYRHLVRAREGREKAFGPDHGPTQHTWQNLAACLAKLGNYSEAAELYQKALKGHTKIFGGDHFWVLHITSNLADLLLKTGQVEEAEVNFQKVLKTRKKILPENHPDIARAKVGLANAYMMESKCKEAADLAKQAVENFEILMGPDDKETADARELLERASLSALTTQ